jgi:hypothetical protein
MGVMIENSVLELQFLAVAQEPHQGFGSGIHFKGVIDDVGIKDQAVVEICDGDKILPLEIVETRMVNRKSARRPL